MSLMLQRSLRLFHSITQAMRIASREPDAAQRWRMSLPGGILIDPSVQFTGLDPDSTRVTIGADCEIQRETTIWLANSPGADARLTLGSRVYIARNCFLGCYQPISIGDHTQLGAYTYLTSANHRFDRRDVPIRDQGFTGQAVIIGSDVWLGTHVTVLPGAVIGNGSIVGAGSVVRGEIPPYEIWGGVPARFIKKRPE